MIVFVFLLISLVCLGIFTGIFLFSTQKNTMKTQDILNHFSSQISERIHDIITLQKNQLDSANTYLQHIHTNTQSHLSSIRETLEKQLHHLQQDNHQKLEQMRQTVDEKLHATLEKRLGDSFQLVSQRLESVYKGLGEMQQLAAGVGDLKRVLTNVKSGGHWGEIQLESLLEQLLTSEQYVKNVKIKPLSNEFVEFAIKLPGKTGDFQSPIFIPIDSKFPMVLYQNLQQAQDLADPNAVEQASKALSDRIKLEAKKIQEKYIDPPHTTDYAILFLPIEGLYAEVLRLKGISDFLNHHRILVAGPTTLGALLNSLQMGFRTLAIEKRSSEVWDLLGIVKKEFQTFGDILDKTQKKLQEAGNQIELASQRSRVIERKLKGVQELSFVESKPVIGSIE